MREIVSFFQTDIKKPLISSIKPYLIDILKYYSLHLKIDVSILVGGIVKFHKKIMIILIISLFLFQSISIAVNNKQLQYQTIDSNEEQMDQNQSTNSGNYVKIDKECLFFAQRFQPELEIFSKISVYLGKKMRADGNIEVIISLRKNIRLEIDQTLIDEENIKRNGGWVNCDFSFNVVNINESYYIIIYAKNVSEKNYIEWYFGSDNPYEQGELHISENDYDWETYRNHAEFKNIDCCFRTYGFKNTPPNRPAKPQGKTEGQFDKPYTYSTSTLDKEENEIYYKWSWGDGNITAWLGPYESGEECTATHTWKIKGSYYIKVKAKDQWGIESDWSDLLAIRMKKSKNYPVIDLFTQHWGIKNSWIRQYFKFYQFFFIFSESIPPKEKNW
ncbi:MAG: PKD domain-containing protein [Desulfobacterales bacterium]